MATALVKEPRQLYLADFIDNTSETFGNKLGLVARLFGCRHKHLTRPFSHNGVGYRTCLYCGARTKFDPETRQTYGEFYYPPPIIN